MEKKKYTKTEYDTAKKAVLKDLENIQIKSRTEIKSEEEVNNLKEASDAYANYLKNKNG